MKQTKIVATIGPASNNYKTIVSMVKAGMNVARINLSHGTAYEHEETINLVKKVRKDLGVPLAIMLDTRGPELRFKTFENGKVELKSGSIFTLVPENVIGTNVQASINHPKALNLLSVGDKVLACDALVTMEVKKVSDAGVEMKVLTGGVVSNNKSLSFPGKVFNFPYLNNEDKTDLIRGINQDIDYIACSFVNSAQDVLRVRKFVEENGGSVKIISKIESVLGVQNIDEIIAVSDGIMVARGDLGVELPFESIPHLQKVIIRKCIKENKFVITATEMLESMITSVRPTRAEASDVANAVFDGSSAVMLSGESAMGKYPVEAVSVMARILEESEKFVDYKRLYDDYKVDSEMISDIISRTVAKLAFKIKTLKAVVVYTDSGHTAIMISKHFPGCPIIALTPNVKTYHTLSAVWGVQAVLTKQIKTADKLIVEIDKIVQANKYAKKGELVLIGTGTRKPSSTDIIKLHIVGE